MIEYKKKALEQFKLENGYSRYFKKCRKEKTCHKCDEIIKVSDIYFCYELVSSYYVDHMYDYHLKCISRNEIIDMIKIVN